VLARRYDRSKKRQVHITSLSLPPLDRLILIQRPVKKKPGYP
jgi:hypothetical protein